MTCVVVWLATVVLSTVLWARSGRYWFDRVTAAEERAAELEVWVRVFADELGRPWPPS